MLRWVYEIQWRRVRDGIIVLTKSINGKQFNKWSGRVGWWHLGGSIRPPPRQNAYFFWPDAARGEKSSIHNHIYLRPHVIHPTSGRRLSSIGEFVVRMEVQLHFHISILSSGDTWRSLFLNKDASKQRGEDMGLYNHGGVYHTHDPKFLFYV